MSRCYTAAMVLGLTLPATGACKRPNPAFLGTGGEGRATSGSTGPTDGTAGLTTTAGPPPTMTSGSGGSGSASSGEGCSLPPPTNQGVEVKVSGPIDPVTCSNSDTPFFSRWARYKTPAGNGKFEVDLCPPGDGGECANCTAAGILEFTAPADLRPEVLPECIKISLYGDPVNDPGPGCLFRGAELKTQLDDMTQTVYPFWVGVARSAEPPGGLTALGQAVNVTKIPLTDEPCPCTDVACCDGVANAYELEFSIGGGFSVVTLEPGGQEDVNLMDSVTYRVMNVEARDDVPCGDPPEIYWAFGDVEYLP